MQAWLRGWEDVREEDLEAVRKLLASGALSVVSGGILTRFERAFARFAGTAHAVAFCNGTAALYAALWACGVGAGDEVLVCDYGFHGMAAAVVSLGAVVVPVDCRPDSLTMDAEDLARARSDRTRAVLVHNPWGVPADWSALRAACPDLPFVSDASHAHGACYAGEPLGRQATVTCWSMGHQKLISGGELGAAATDDPELRDRMVILGHTNRRELAVNPWTGNAVGLKLRPHPVALTLALGQLKRFEEKLSALRETCARVEAAFESAGLRKQAVPRGAERSYWRVVLHCPFEVAEVEARLRNAGVPAEPNHYWPTLQHQPLFTWPGRTVRHRSCPVAREVVPRLVTLPAPARLAKEALESAVRVVSGQAATRGIHEPVPERGGAV
ncbi:MAG: aminotransferase class I/II-fold pyridoxal phosphate-dependent enzyme [Candidatus Eremiobacterota bacterium]